MKLTDKQKRFCEEYLVDLDASKAARRAGYSATTAGQIGAELLGKKNVQEKIQQLQERRSRRVEITADRVLQELASIGFAKITDFLEVADQNVNTEKHEKEKEEKNLSSLVKIYATNKVPGEAVPAIASIKQGVNGIELKLHDKTKALELIARHLGMLNDKLIVNADEELKNLYRTIMSEDD